MKSRCVKKALFLWKTLHKKPEASSAVCCLWTLREPGFWQRPHSDLRKHHGLDSRGTQESISFTFPLVGGRGLIKYSLPC